MNNMILKKNLLFLLTIIIMFCFNCINKKSPNIYVDGLSYKFGKVKEGEKVVFTFFFKNTGTDNLVIEDLYISCYCMEVKKYDKVVKPDERGQIYGIIKTKGFQGEIIKALQVKTNIKNKEPIVLTIEGEILKK